MFLQPKISKFSFITIVRAFTSTSIGRFPSVVCLCDLNRGLNQLSDLMTLQLGFWLQEQTRGGDSGVSHGDLVGGCQGGTSGVESVFPVLFPSKDSLLRTQSYCDSCTKNFTSVFVVSVFFLV